MKKEYTLKNGSRIWLNRIRGTVLDVATHLTTEHRQTAGYTQIAVGSNSNGEDFHVAYRVPGQSYSELTTKNSIWVLDEETSTEVNVPIGNMDVPVRAGHRVSLIVGAADKMPNAGLASMYNHDTKNGQTALENTIVANWKLIPKGKATFWKIASAVAFAFALIGPKSVDITDEFTVWLFQAALWSFAGLVAGYATAVGYLVFGEGPRIKATDEEIKSLARAFARED